ncbi:hypothetical protein D3C75_1330800 [compost metagenome]
MLKQNLVQLLIQHIEASDDQGNRLGIQVQMIPKMLNSKMHHSSRHFVPDLMLIP